MQTLEASDGVIHASLIDDSNEIIETRTVDIAENLSAEDTAVQTIQFEKIGVSVIAVYEDTTSGDDPPDGGGTTPPNGGGETTPPGGGTTPPNSGATIQGGGIKLNR
jgi:hypothetical protein